VLFLICVDFIIYFMRTNPGGGLAPAEVVGRDALIADLWDKLEHHSVMMTAERRMGKTSVLKKMLAQQPPGVTAFYWDLENIRSPEALVREIFNKAQKLGIGRGEDCWSQLTQARFDLATTSARHGARSFGSSGRSRTLVIFIR
jgi:hypothetical protein